MTTCNLAKIWEGIIFFAIFFGQPASSVRGTATVEEPDRIPNPLAPEMVEAIHTVILGNYSGGQDWEVTPIEIINDPYRIGIIKEMLAVPALHKKAQPSFIGGAYHLICIDKDKRIVVAAAYYLTRQFGYVLQLSANAIEKDGHYFDYSSGDKRTPGSWDPKIDYRKYVIPFNDRWQEAIGYTPAW